MLTENLYIFPDAVNRNSEAETISLDITGDTLFFYHNGKVNIIDTSVLADGTSTVILNNSMTGATYVLFN
ncbi:MAG: hypothetical protein HUJ75_07980, partial [Parasporobacterium sp.]|nr:hypothetical protein [Parasporobacterium sp.]